MKEAYAKLAKKPTRLSFLIIRGRYLDPDIIQDYSCIRDDVKKDVYDRMKIVKINNKGARLGIDFRQVEGEGGLTQTLTAGGAAALEGTLQVI